MLSIIGIIGGILSIILTGNRFCTEVFLGIELSLLLGIISIFLGAYTRLKEKEEFGSIAVILGILSFFINGFLFMLAVFSGMP